MNKLSNNDLNFSDYNKALELNKIRNMNFKALDIIVDLLTNKPDFVDSKLIAKMIRKVPTLSQKNAYLALVCAIFDLDEHNADDKEIINSYLNPSIKELDITPYVNNKYYKNIKITPSKIGTWEFLYKNYEPFEIFVYNDIEVDKNFKEVPQLGFFKEKFTYPTVLENGIEWMLITPNEINTMQPHIDKVSGNVITFGLGLGYFPYMTSLKDNVESITIVEVNKDVIKLFEENILPQFPNKHKVKIINADAYDFIKNEMTNNVYDYAFIDLWHDSSDGLEHYKKLKKLENLHKKTQFLYWIEKSILSRMRWPIFDFLYDQCIQLHNENKLYNENSSEIISHFISDENLKLLISLQTPTSK